ncbi:MAG: DUF1292 domain-containing protein [Lachnospiraceae bacterium]|jgi:uncharacterized protein YrzB (UPF0473 family)|nr:DUF1292 domain-containing protein [Lachnospiraceae bacterium]
MAKEFENDCSSAGCTSDCSSCGCDCGSGLLNEGEDGHMTVTLTLDDDSSLECIVLTTFEAAGRNYIALLPTNPPEGEEGEVYLYRFVTGPNGEPDLQNIEDDEEYEAVADAFDEILDAAEFDELVEEEMEESDSL